MPLVGIRCCINYNPVPAQCQFGYPIRGAPTPASLTALLFYYEDSDATKVLQQVRSVWKSVVCMDRDSRSWTINREIPYRQWIVDRVEKVKFPFKLDSPGLINEEQRPDTESKEVKRLKEEIERLKGTNAKVVNDLQSLRHNFVDLNKDYEEKTKAYKELMRKQKAERDYTFRIKQDLAAANTELSMRAQERDIASSAERQWKSLYEDIKREKQEALRRLHDLQVEVNDMEQQMKEVMIECEEQVGEEHRQRIEAEEQYQTVLAQIEGHMDE